ncbi:MAG TPA: hypothetical protein VIJ86_09165 [Acidimicrobiales bacterium]
MIINSERRTSTGHPRPLSNILSFFGLVLLVWGIVSPVVNSSSSLHRLVVFVLLTVASAA